MSIGKAHELVHRRRVRVLAQHLAPLLPQDATVLDVGCGDGRLATALMQQRPDLRITGIDVLARMDARIPVRRFNGRRIPLSARGVDVVLLIDVLHHTTDPEAMLREARRVTRKALIIKDHLRHGAASAFLLQVMDWVGNARHGVALPHTYWSEPQWRSAFRALGLRIRTWKRRLGLYPWPTTLLFDRSLHFITKVER